MDFCLCASSNLNSPKHLMSPGDTIHSAPHRATSPVPLSRFWALHSLPCKIEALSLYLCLDCRAKSYSVISCRPLSIFFFFCQDNHSESFKIQLLGCRLQEHQSFQAKVDLPSCLCEPLSLHSSQSIVIDPLYLHFYLTH